MVQELVDVFGEEVGKWRGSLERKSWGRYIYVVVDHRIVSRRMIVSKCDEK